MQSRAVDVRVACRKKVKLAKVTKKRLDEFKADAVMTVTAIFDSYRKEEAKIQQLAAFFSAERVKAMIETFAASFEPLMQEAEAFSTKSANQQSDELAKIDKQAIADLAKIKTNEEVIEEMALKIEDLSRQNAEKEAALIAKD